MEFTITISKDNSSKVIICKNYECFLWGSVSILSVEHAGRDDRHRNDAVQIGIEVGGDDHHDSQMMTQELSDNDEDEDGIDTNQGMSVLVSEVFLVRVFMYGHNAFKTSQKLLQQYGCIWR